MDDASSPAPDPLFGLKAQAQALQLEAKAANRTLKRADALEAVARLNGYKDWNAAVAAAKADKLEAYPEPDFAGWRQVAAPLPRLPVRLVKPGDRNHAAVDELMRWAKQLDFLSSRALDDEEDVGDLMAIIGGDMPYVFVYDLNRFDDRLYHLCDRGYDEIDGVVFTREQLEQSGVVAWQNLRGSHDGSTMFSVVDDNLRMHSDRAVLQQAARVVASIALIADASLAKAGDDETLGLAAVAQAVRALSAPEKRLLRLAMEGAPGRRVTSREYGERFALSQGEAAEHLRTAADSLFDVTVKFAGSRPGSYDVQRLLTACDQMGSAVRLSIAPAVRQVLARIPEYLDESSGLE